MNVAELTQEARPASPSTINRRLVAIAFADVAGFSRLMALNDVETVRRWKAVRTEIMEPHMNRHGGRACRSGRRRRIGGVPKRRQRGSMGLRCPAHPHGEPRENDPFALHLRIGINVDDAIDDDGILSGDGVNIASRIHQAAEPDQIVVTGDRT